MKTAWLGLLAPPFMVYKKRSAAMCTGPIAVFWLTGIISLLYGLEGGPLAEHQQRRQRRHQSPRQGFVDRAIHHFDGRAPTNDAEVLPNPIEDDDGVVQLVTDDGQQSGQHG